MFEKRKMQKSKLVKLKNCCQANKENVWPSFVGGNNSPSSIVWFEKMAWVYDLICSISCKHVYIICAFYVKKQWSQLLDLTAVVCTTWLRHIGHTRQHTKEFCKLFIQNGNAILLKKSVNHRYKMELFKRKNEIKNVPVHRNRCNNLRCQNISKYCLNWLVSIKKEKIILEVAVPFQWVIFSSKIKRKLWQERNGGGPNSFS